MTSFRDQIAALPQYRVESWTVPPFDAIERSKVLAILDAAPDWKARYDELAAIISDHPAERDHASIVALAQCHRQDAETADRLDAASRPTAPWKCKAQQNVDPPQDCDWPTCGCDPYADKVIAALDESGATAGPEILAVTNFVESVAREECCWSRPPFSHTCASDKLRGDGPLCKACRAQELRDAVKHIRERIQRSTRLTAADLNFRITSTSVLQVPAPALRDAAQKVTWDMEANDWPRRAQMLLWTPAEHAIAKAVEAVESAGADVRLTDAVVLLQAARDAVADFVDGIEKRRNVQITDGLAALLTREGPPHTRETETP